VNYRTFLPFVAMAVAVPLAIHACRKADPAQHVQDVAYPVVCLKCGETYELTTREMNAMIARGEADSPPGRMRSFTCKTCGKKSVTLDGAMGHETPGG